MDPVLYEVEGDSWVNDEEKQQQEANGEVGVFTSKSRDNVDGLGEVTSAAEKADDSLLHAGGGSHNHHHHSGSGTVLEGGNNSGGPDNSGTNTRDTTIAIVSPPTESRDNLDGDPSHGMDSSNMESSMHIMESGGECNIIVGRDSSGTGESSSGVDSRRSPHQLEGSSETYSNSNGQLDINAAAAAVVVVGGAEDQEEHGMYQIDFGEEDNNCPSTYTSASQKQDAEIIEEDGREASAVHHCEEEEEVVHGTMADHDSIVAIGGEAAMSRSTASIQLPGEVHVAADGEEERGGVEEENIYSASVSPSSWRHRRHQEEQQHDEENNADDYERSSEERRDRSYVEEVVAEEEDEARGIGGKQRDERRRHESTRQRRRRRSSTRSSGAVVSGDRDSSERGVTVTQREEDAQSHIEEMTMRRSRYNSEEKEVILDTASTTREGGGGGVISSSATGEERDGMGSGDDRDPLYEEGGDREKSSRRSGERRQEEKSTSRSPFSLNKNTLRGGGGDSRRQQPQQRSIEKEDSGANHSGTTTSTTTGGGGSGGGGGSRQQQKQKQQSTSTTTSSVSTQHTTQQKEAKKNQPVASTATTTTRKKKDPFEGWPQEAITEDIEDFGPIDSALQRKVLGVLRGSTCSIKLTSEDAAFIVGKGGSTKRKIVTVSGCRIGLEDDGLRLDITGTTDQREKALLYIRLVMQQRLGAVRWDSVNNDLIAGQGTIVRLDDDGEGTAGGTGKTATEDVGVDGGGSSKSGGVGTQGQKRKPRKRDDLTILMVPSDAVGYVTGCNGAVLRRIEDEWGTLMFFSQQQRRGRGAAKAAAGIPEKAAAVPAAGPSKNDAGGTKSATIDGSDAGGNETATQVATEGEEDVDDTAVKKTEEGLVEVKEDKIVATPEKEEQTAAVPETGERDGSVSEKEEGTGAEDSEHTAEAAVCEAEMRETHASSNSTSSSRNGRSAGGADGVVVAPSKANAEPTGEEETAHDENSSTCAAVTYGVAKEKVTKGDQEQQMMADIKEEKNEKTKVKQVLQKRSDSGKQTGEGDDAPLNDGNATETAAHVKRELQQTTPDVGAGGESLTQAQKEAFSNINAKSPFASVSMEQLLIFGTERSRLGATLKVMSAVDQKLRGFYSERLRQLLLQRGICSSPSSGKTVKETRRDSYGSNVSGGGKEGEDGSANERRREAEGENPMEEGGEQGQRRFAEKKDKNKAKKEDHDDAEERSKYNSKRDEMISSENGRTASYEREEEEDKGEEGAHGKSSARGRRYSTSKKSGGSHGDETEVDMAAERSQLPEKEKENEDGTGDTIAAEEENDKERHTGRRLEAEEEIEENKERMAVQEDNDDKDRGNEEEEERDNGGEKLQRSVSPSGDGGVKRHTDVRGQARRGGGGGVEDGSCKGKNEKGGETATAEIAESETNIDREDMRDKPVEGSSTATTTTTIFESLQVNRVLLTTDLAHLSSGSFLLQVLETASATDTMTEGRGASSAAGARGDGGDEGGGSGSAASFSSVASSPLKKGLKSEREGGEGGGEVRRNLKEDREGDMDHDGGIDLSNNSGSSRRSPEEDKENRTRAAGVLVHQLEDMGAERGDTATPETADKISKVERSRNRRGSDCEERRGEQRLRAENGGQREGADQLHEEGGGQMEEREEERQHSLDHHEEEEGKQEESKEQRTQRSTESSFHREAHGSSEHDSDMEEQQQQHGHHDDEGKDNTHEEEVSEERNVREKEEEQEQDDQHQQKVKVKKEEKKHVKKQNAKEKKQQQQQKRSKQNRDAPPNRETQTTVGGGGGGGGGGSGRRGGDKGRSPGNRITTAGEARKEGGEVETGGAESKTAGSPSADRLLVDVIEIEEEHFSYCLGKEGKTRRKLAAAAACIVEYIGHYAFIAGLRTERKRAAEYLRLLVLQRSIPIFLHDLLIPNPTASSTAAGRKDLVPRSDLTVLELPKERGVMLTGRKGGVLLREVEEETRTLCFIEGKRAGKQPPGVPTTANPSAPYERVLVLAAVPEARRMAVASLQRALGLLPTGGEWSYSSSSSRRVGGDDGTGTNNAAYLPLLPSPGTGLCFPRTAGGSCGPLPFFYPSHAAAAALAAAAAASVAPPLSLRRDPSQVRESGGSSTRLDGGSSSSSSTSTRAGSSSSSTTTTTTATVASSSSSRRRRSDGRPFPTQRLFPAAETATPEDLYTTRSTAAGPPHPSIPPYYYGPAAAGAARSPPLLLSPTSAARSGEGLLLRPAPYGDGPPHTRRPGGEGAAGAGEGYLLHLPLAGPASAGASGAAAYLSSRRGPPTAAAALERGLPTGAGGAGGRSSNSSGILGQGGRHYMDAAAGPPGSSSDRYYPPLYPPRSSFVRGGGGMLGTPTAASDYDGASRGGYLTPGGSVCGGGSMRVLHATPGGAAAGGAGLLRTPMPFPRLHPAAARDPFRRRLGDGEYYIHEPGSSGGGPLLRYSAAAAGGGGGGLGPGSISSSSGGHYYPSETNAGLKALDERGSSRIDRYQQGGSPRHGAVLLTAAPTAAPHNHRHRSGSSPYAAARSSKRHRDESPGFQPSPGGAPSGPTRRAGYTHEFVHMSAEDGKTEATGGSYYHHDTAHAERGRRTTGDRRRSSSRSAGSHGRGRSRRRSGSSPYVREDQQQHRMRRQHHGGGGPASPLSVDGGQRHATERRPDGEYARYSPERKKKKEIDDESAAQHQPRHSRGGGSSAVVQQQHYGEDDEKHKTRQRSKGRGEGASSNSSTTQEQQRFTGSSSRRGGTPSTGGGSSVSYASSSHSYRPYAAEESPSAGAAGAAGLHAPYSTAPSHYESSSRGSTTADPYASASHRKRRVEGRSPGPMQHPQQQQSHGGPADTQQHQRGGSPLQLRGSHGSSSYDPYSMDRQRSGGGSSSSGAAGPERPIGPVPRGGGRGGRGNSSEEWGFGAADGGIGGGSGSAKTGTPLMYSNPAGVYMHPAAGGSSSSVPTHASGWPPSMVDCMPPAADVGSSGRVATDYSGSKNYVPSGGGAAASAREMESSSGGGFQRVAGTVDGGRRFVDGRGEPWGGSSAISEVGVPAMHEEPQYGNSRVADYHFPAASAVAKERDRSSTGKSAAAGTQEAGIVVGGSGGGGRGGGGGGSTATTAGRGGERERDDRRDGGRGWHASAGAPLVEHYMQQQQQEQDSRTARRDGGRREERGGRTRYGGSADGSDGGGGGGAGAYQAAYSSVPVAPGVADQPYYTEPSWEQQQHQRGMRSDSGRRGGGGRGHGDDVATDNRQHEWSTNSSSSSNVRKDPAGAGGGAGAGGSASGKREGLQHQQHHQPGGSYEGAARRDHHTQHGRVSTHARSGREGSDQRGLRQGDVESSTRMPGSEAHPSRESPLVEGSPAAAYYSSSYDDNSYEKKRRGETDGGQQSQGTYAYDRYGREDDRGLIAAIDGRGGGEGLERGVGRTPPTSRPVAVGYEDRGMAGSAGRERATGSAAGGSAYRTKGPYDRGEQQQGSKRSVSSESKSPVLMGYGGYSSGNTGESSIAVPQHSSISTQRRSGRGVYEPVQGHTRDKHEGGGGRYAGTAGVYNAASSRDHYYSRNTGASANNRGSM